MSAVPTRPSQETRTRVARAAGDLGAAAVRQMESDHAWFRSLSAEDRSWVGLVAQAGISSFLEWFGGEQSRAAVLADVFGTAPRELTRSISLAQTLDLIRTVIAVVERDISGLAAPGEEDLAREAVLRYSREVAFAAAEVYAEAAEARGAWDARLESLVVDAVIRGEADDSMQSRAAALGWGAVSSVAVVVGSTPPGATGSVLGELHRTARRVGSELLVAVHGPRVVCIAGSVADPMALATALDPHLGSGPLVVGPTVPHLFAAGRSARAAISGHTAAPAWPDAPRPVAADDLLAERALLGDLPARNALRARIIAPLADAGGGALLDTAAAWLDRGLGVEGTARHLIVHPNTVRYRLAGIEKATGYDLADAHDAQTVRIALAMHRLGPGARVVPAR
ncbi:helix-turn-helix domain-containing protein [Nostocoides sp. Soil756]|uniref:PucR family transcriptional regulator n=1 Tax=Nostocoides sp. Soil756 TaxID=1736399 RepID=UPI0007016F80|nr:helix-turn-helix domain-containing protein [Tetrasphaera sp. Soil756]KRE62582.1 PucR family transcriptional regulator [Tetrasphaera sp. Soil756]